MTNKNEMRNCNTPKTYFDHHMAGELVKMIKFDL